jgi:hypothetical protein
MIGTGLSTCFGRGGEMVTWRDVVRDELGAATEDAVCDVVLWEYTAFPLASEAEIRSQLREAREAARRELTDDVCSYCHEEPAAFDPVLGWVCVKCEREITDGVEDAAEQGEA